MAENTVSVRRASKILGVSEVTVYEWLRSGRLKGQPPIPANVDADHLAEIAEVTKASIRALVEDPNTSSPRYRTIHREQQAVEVANA